MHAMLSSLVCCDYKLSQQTHEFPDCFASPTWTQSYFAGYIANISLRPGLSSTKQEMWIKYIEECKSLGP